MHGRQKVEQTAEEDQRKQKERSMKVAAYQHAMGIIFDKRQKKQVDEQTMEIIAKVLSSNPDISTLWNIRREFLQQLKMNDETKFSDFVTKELGLTEICLRENPKSYSTWHQRCWLMKETNFERVPDELKLCSKYLKLDERNFHCWNYRRFLLNNSESMTLQQELEFSTEKIISNFSNYSSWHLRSTILPKISSLSDSYLGSELDLIKNAAFTDPNDQSVWLYYRWLLKSQLSSPQNETEPKSEAFTKILLGELEWVQELNEVEPDNKWVLSTLILLMRLINFKGYKDVIANCLTKLIELDKSRLNYYLHLSAKYQSEWSQAA